MAERDRVREPEPEQESNYDQAMAQYAAVRDRVNRPYVVRGSERQWEFNKQGKAKFYSYPPYEDSVLPDMKVFKHEIPDRSGRHTHQGGYTIVGLRGEGETLVGDERVDWSVGDVVVLPFQPGGVEHQHFNKNEPDEPATWLAINWNPYLLHTGAMFKQQETSDHWEGSGDGDHDRDGGGGGDGFVHEEMADFSYDDWIDYEPPDEPETRYDELIARRNVQRRQMAEAREAGNWKKITESQLEWEWNPQGKMKWYVHPAHTDRSMKALILSLQDIPPGSKSGKQLRQGGQVHFFTQGTGHSIVDGERYDWGADDYLGLPVKPEGLTVQHFNDDPETPVRLFRAEPYVHEAVTYDMGCGFKQLEACPEYR